MNNRKIWLDGYDQGHEDGFIEAEHFRSGNPPPSTASGDKVWEAFCAELTQEPTDDMKEALASALRKIVVEHSYNFDKNFDKNFNIGGDHRVSVVNVKDLLNIATELDT